MFIGLILECHLSLDYTIDIRDYVNGIGNRSREPYIHARTPCYSLHPVANQKLAKKWPSSGTAAPLLINNSSTEEVPSLSQVYSSEGVISLNMDNKDGASKPLLLAMVPQSPRSKMADFSPFS